MLFVTTSENQIRCNAIMYVCAAVCVADNSVMA